MCKERAYLFDLKSASVKFQTAMCPRIFLIQSVFECNTDLLFQVNLEGSCDQFLRYAAISDVVPVATRSCVSAVMLVQFSVEMHSAQI